MAAAGLTTLPSAFGAKETADRLEAEVRSRGLTVFARIDHAAGAAQAGLSMPAAELLVFGSAQGGTPLMQSGPTIAIDLPLKALVWQDAGGQVWLSYNEPAWLADRHGLGPEARSTVEKLAALLAAVAKKAVTSGGSSPASLFLPSPSHPSCRAASWPRPS